jgi:hypothetical protein
MFALLLMSAMPQEAGLCSASPAEVLVGERYRRGVPTRAKRLSGARTVRVIWPGQAVTLDFREDRLNLRVDYRRRITAVRCG